MNGLTGDASASVYHSTLAACLWRPRRYADFHGIKEDLRRTPNPNEEGSIARKLPSSRDWLERPASNQKRQKRQAHSLANIERYADRRASVVECGCPFCRFSFTAAPTPRHFRSRPLAELALRACGIGGAFETSRSVFGLLSSLVIRHSASLQADQRCPSWQLHHNGARDFIMPALLVVVPNDPEKAKEHYNN